MCRFMHQIQEKIERLRRQVLYHAKRYYVDDDPEISDYEYDMMYAELLRLEAENPAFFLQSLYYCMLFNISFALPCVFS